MIRHPRQEEISPIRLTVTSRKVPSKVLASPLMIMYAFAGFISIGTALLLIPFTHHGGGITPVMTAVFTATSAVTVTGLIIQDTAEYWTRFGQVVILGLMFVGGLGFMTLATFMLIVIGQRVTLSQRLLVRESLGVNQLGGLVRLTVSIVLVAVGIQIAGFVALAIRFNFLYDPAEAVWQAAFHAVSGFNNAGFIVLNEAGGLIALQQDKIILGIISILVILGGLSYWVMVDIVRLRKFSLFSLNTKLVLTLFAIVIVIGTIAFLGFEFDNPSTIGDMSLDDKVMVSLFQSVSGRTAGFDAADFKSANDETHFIYTGLMFIGGASASVAGGVKVNTVAIILIAMLSAFRGRTHVSSFGREIPQAQVRRAMVIGAVSTVVVFFVALLMIFSESGFEFLDLFFETVSAFGTVGLTSGLTDELSNWGQSILIFAMFIGRLGPLTIALALARSTETDMYRYAQERVTIG